MSPQAKRVRSSSRGGGGGGYNRFLSGMWGHTLGFGFVPSFGPISSLCFGRRASGCCLARTRRAFCSRSWWLEMAL